jgi:hypothetical protein
MSEVFDIQKVDYDKQVNLRQEQLR